MNTPPHIAIRCHGCDHEVDWQHQWPFGCPNAKDGDDIDHILTKELSWPEREVTARHLFDSSAGAIGNPFIAFRDFQLSYWLARERGMSDQWYCRLVERFDRDVANVDGHGFDATPFGRDAELSTALGFSAQGGVWLKDDSGNVGGSHKARHLMGLMLYLLVDQKTREHGDLRDAPLAIASCGNAALAAAVIAKAASWPIHVYVPDDANPGVLERLDALGAHINRCHRTQGELGDPCYLAFRKGIAAGQIPFCCQGNANGLTIEGGETLAFEIIAQLGAVELDALVIQVGGGALGSSVMQAFERIYNMGIIGQRPRLYTVQTNGAYPLKRAFDRLAGDAPLPTEWVTDAFFSAQFRRYLQGKRRQRHTWMTPWESEPQSIASGILDDETYDAWQLLLAHFRNGGFPIVASEEQLDTANQMVSDLDASYTGTAGLAGLLELRKQNKISSTETVGILITGRKR